MNFEHGGPSYTSSDLFGMLDETVASSLLRVACGHCIGCGVSNARAIYWRYRLGMSRGELQYDTLTVCQPCYDRLHAAGWTEEHEVSKAEYDRWHKSVAT